MNSNNKLVVPSTAQTRFAFGTSILASDKVKTILVLGVFSYIYKEHSIYDDTKYTFRLQDLKKFLCIPRGGQTLI